MTELVAAAAPDELLILPRGKVRLHGIDFDEDFLSELVARYFRRQQWQAKPRFSDAYDIYMRENPSANRRKFKTVAQQSYALFVALFGDMPLDELRHVHITEFRDSRLARGLHANSVRRHINMLNAMVNMAYKHLDIDRLSPFRRLYIRGEGELSRTMAPITVEHLRKVKVHLLSHPIPSRLAALIQLNTGMRISEPVLARLDDLVLDHDIPHLWVRKNSLAQTFALLYEGAGLEGASSHSGRRTFLTSLANKGTAIHVLKTLAGHRSISTTAAYLYSSPAQLRAAVELV